MKCSYIFLILLSQYIAANPIPEFYRLQHTSWGSGVHNGMFTYEGPDRIGRVISYVQKNNITYELKLLGEESLGLYRITEDQRELVSKSILPGYLVDVYEEGDVLSLAVLHRNGYRILVYEYEDGGYEKKVYTDVYNKEIVFEGEDETIEKIKFVNPYELEIIRRSENQELYSLKTKKITGLPAEDMKRQPFLIVGELPDQSALSRFNNRKAKNLNNPINKAPDLKSRKSMDLDIPSDNSITSPTFLVVSLIMCALSIIVFARYIYVKKM